METTTETRSAAEALRIAGVALMDARHKFRLAHKAFLVESGVDPEEASRLAFEFSARL